MVKREKTRNSAMPLVNLKFYLDLASITQLFFVLLRAYINFFLDVQETWKLLREIVKMSHIDYIFSVAFVVVH